MSNPDDLIKEVVTGTLSDTAAKVLQTDIAKALFEQSAIELGSLFAQVAGVVRFYAQDNLEKIFIRWAQTRHSKPFSEQEIQRVMPLLQAASMDSRGELHGRWANLLEAVARDGEVLPSFSICLSQLSGKEAKYLDLLWPLDGGYGGFLEKQAFFLKYIGLYPRSVSDVDPDDVQAIDKQQKDFETLFTDLLRLGLLERITKLADTRGQTTQVRMQVGKVIVGGQTIELYGFSEYGKRFMKAIASPDHETAK